jgi:hypothetical protein
MDKMSSTEEERHYLPKQFSSSSTQFSKGGFENPIIALEKLNPSFGKKSKHPLLICAGYGHTGTRSLEAALELMGLRTEHWSKISKELVLSGGHEKYDYNFHIFNNVDAIIDIPIPEFFIEILISYPNSKVLLTVRDWKKWIHSIGVNRSSSQQIRDCYEKLNPRQIKVRQIQFGSPCPAPHQLVKRYLLHNRAVIDIVPQNRLEIIDIFHDTDPFSKLSKLTGRLHPQVPFPHVH